MSIVSAYFLVMRKSIIALLSIVFAAGAVSVCAQVVPAAKKGLFSLTVGGMGSAFQPDYVGDNTVQASPYRLYGVGTYVDVRFTRWVQIEGEARWLRFNQFINIYQDNYLIGYRAPIHHFHFLRMTPYGKALIGFAYMPIVYPDENYMERGRFTDIAYGGGVDFELTRRFTARVDYELQEYPKFIQNSAMQNQHLFPNGASVGIGYRIF